VIVVVGAGSIDGWILIEKIDVMVATDLAVATPFIGLERNESPGLANGIGYFLGMFPHLVGHFETVVTDSAEIEPGHTFAKVVELLDGAPTVGVKGMPMEVTP
jgi:hypothetical protein